MPRRLLTWVLLLVGVTAVVVGGQQVGAASGSAPVRVEPAGAVPVAGLTGSGSPSPAPPARRTPAPGPTATVARTEPLPGLPGPPVEVRVPALGLRAPIEPVGVRDGGAVAVPADVDTVGWVATTSRPGTRRGTATVVGHVDDEHGSSGVLHRLYAARPGQRVLIRTSTGDVLPYRIQAISLYARSALPGDLFARDGRARLALVTCAGRYEPGRGYSDNLVVWAVPADGWDPSA